MFFDFSQVLVYKIHVIIKLWHIVQILKQRALNYIKEGHSHVEASKVFDVGVRTLFTWEKKLREQGHLERKKRVAKSRKIPLEKLKAFVEAHPDAFLREIAAHFDCAVPSVWAALKQINVTLKKDD